MTVPRSTGLFLSCVLVIATVASAAPGAPDLAAASDSGSSDSDNVTNVTTPTFSGTANPGDTVELFSDIDGSLGTTTADATTGAYSLVVASAMSSDTHQVTAEESSDSGNPGPALAVTIDTTAPSAPSAPDLDPASDTGASNSDNLTGDTTPTFNGTAEADSVVTLTSSEAGQVGTGPASGGNWSITASTLAAVVHSMTATATDAAGNTSVASGALAVTINTTPPATPSAPDLAQASDTGSSDSDDITNDDTPTFTGTATADITVEILSSIDGTVGSGSAGGGTYSITTSALTDGDHQFTARTVSGSGTPSAPSAALSVTIDTAAPTPTVDLAAASDTGSSSTDNITSDDTPEFNVTGAGGLSGLTLDSDVDGQLETATADGSGNSTIQVMAGNELSLGVHQISVTATDLAGNAGSSANLQVTIGVDLSVAIVGLPSSAIPGEQVSYDIQITKNGPGEVNEITLSGVVAPGLLNPVVFTADGFLLPSAPAPQWRDLTLTSGSVTATVHGILDPSLTGTFDVDVTATTSGFADIDTSNNDDSESSTLNPEADLQITKSNGVTALSPRDPFTWSIEITNLGPSDVAGATLTDVIPTADLDNVPAAGNCGPGAFIDYLESDGDTNLNDSSSLAMSPDGAHLYAVGSPINSIVSFDRAADGSLTLLQSQSGLTELGGESSAVVSPDGRHVYVTGSTSDSVVVFTRDADSASLTYGELTGPDPGASGIDGAIGVAISPDGRNIYVTGADDNTLVVLTRDAATGGLTLLETWTDGGAVDELAGARAVAVSPNGLQVFVVAQGDNSLSAFDRDPVDGSLSFDGSATDLDTPRSLAVSPDGADVYVASSGEDRVRGYRTATLAVIDFPGTVIGPETVRVTSDGERVLVTGRTVIGSLTALNRNETTGVLDAVAVFSSQDEGGNDIFSGLNQAAGLAISPDGLIAHVGGESFPPASPAAISSLVIRRQASCADSNPAIAALAAGIAVDIEAGGRAVISVSAQVKENPPSNSLENTAYVVAPPSVTDPAPAADPGAPGYDCSTAAPDNNNCAVDVDPVNQLADIVVTKTGSERVVPGDSSNPLEYTVVIQNLGPQSTTGGSPDITFSDNLPTQFFSSYQWYCEAEGGAVCPTGTGSAAAPIVNADIGSHTFDLSATPTARLIFTVTAMVVADAATMTADLMDCPSPGPANRCIANTATVSLSPGLYADPTPNNDMADAFTRVDSTADLTITKEGRFLPLPLYEIGYTSIFGSPQIGSELLNLFTGARGVIQEVRPDVLVVAEIVGEFRNNDILFSPTSSNPLEPFFYAWEVGDPVISTVGEPLVFYTIVVENLGPSDVFGATVNDTFPPGIRKSQPDDLTWACDPVSACTPSNGMLDIIDLVVDLAVGERVTITASGGLEASPPAVLTNTVTVDPPIGTNDPSLPNSATDRLVLVAEGDLAITKNDGSAQATPGEEISYSMVVSNNGPEDLFGVTVLDPVPPGILDASWTCSAEPPRSGELQFLDSVGQSGLVGAGDIALSPDDVHIYAAMGDGNSLVVYNRVRTEGPDFGNVDPTPVQLLANGVSGLKGLAEATSVAVSPDGRHVYVVGRGNGAILVFARDGNPASGDYGKLSPIQALQGSVANGTDAIAGADVIDGLDGVGVLTLDGQGKNLYAAGDTADKALVVFNRNDTTGQLTRAEAFQDDSGTVVGDATSLPLLDGMSDLVVSPDGDHLYVSASVDGTINVFDRDGDGGLTPGSSVQDDVTLDVDSLAGVSGIAISPDGAHLYAAAPGDGAVTFFSRSLSTGEISHRDDIALAGVRNLVVAPPGQPLAPDGQHVYAAVESGSALAVFRRSTVTGGLTLLDTVENGDPVLDGNGELTGRIVNGLGGVVPVSISSDGESVYALGADFGTVVAFSRKGSPPSFRFEGVVVDGDQQGEPGFEVTVRGIGSATSVVTSPTVGTHVYATGLADDAVAIFRRNVDPTSQSYGLLTFIEVLQDDDSSNPIPGATLVDGLLGASEIAISPDGDFVYVTSRDESALVVFERGNNPLELENFGRLSRLAVFQDDDVIGSDPVLGAVEVDGLFGALGVVATNQYIYAAGPFDAGISIFERLPDDSHAFVGAKLNGPGDAGAGTEAVEGLQGVAALALTPTHLYAVGSFEDSLVAFSRESGTGELTFLDAWRNGQSGIDGLDRPLGLGLSADGEHLYVAGSFDNAVSVFGVDTFAGSLPDDPNPNFGLLDFLQVLRDDDPILAGGEVVGTVDGLEGARSLVVSADGARVYVASEFEGALAVFARNEDPASLNFGTLSFVETQKDGEGPIDGLDQAYAVSVSPDDRHIYIAGLGDNAIATFFRTRSSSCSASGTGDIRDSIDIAEGGTVTYTLTGIVDPSATGELTNTAYALPCSLDPDGVCQPTNASDPSGGIDPATSLPAVGPYDCPEDGSDNNCSSDTNTLFPRGDLGISKTNSQTTIVPGEEATYTIIVDNDGPSNVTGIQVLDDLDGIFELDGAGDPIVEWTCEAIPTGRLDFIEAIADGELGLAGLGSPSGVVVSNDGRHVYTTSLEDDVVSVFERDLLDGSLTPIDKQTLSEVPEIDGPSDIAISADDAWVYVTGQVADALVVFARVTDAGDPDFGKLALAATDTTELDQPVAVAVHPVDPFVYVASSNSDSLVVFEQLPGGGLSFVESEVDGEADDPESMPKTVSGLGGASGVAVSPDGQNVYVTGTSDGAVAWFTTRVDGFLEWQDERNVLLVPELAGVGSIAVVADPDGLGTSGGEHVYVASETEGAVVVFERNTTTGDLAPVQTLVDDEDGVSGLGGARSVALSADGVNVYVAGRIDSTVAVFARDFDAASAGFGRLDFVEVKRDGFGGVDGLRGAVAVATSGDGRSVYAAGQGDAKIAVFKRASDTRCGNTTGVGNLDLLVDVAAGAEVILTITGIVQPGLIGEISNIAEIVPPPDVDTDEDDNQAEDRDDLRPRADLEITKTDELITIDGLDSVSALALSPNGQSLYAVGREDGAIAAFAHDGSGGLDFLEVHVDNEEGVDGLNGVVAVAASGDGLNVYTAGSEDSAVTVFQRDEVTGRLNLLSTMTNNQGGISGLLGASGVAVIADGAQVAATGASADSLVVFNRDDDPESASVGALVFNQVISNGDTQDSVTVAGLGGAVAVAESSDTNTIYVAGRTDSAIAVFERDAETELLTFIQVVADGDELGGTTVEGLLGVRALTVVDDFVYAVGETDGSVVVIERDGESGELVGILQVVRDGDELGGGTVRGLAGARAIVVSSDDERAYVAGAEVASIVVFERLLDGSLDFLVSVENGDPEEVKGLGGVGSLALDDAHLFAGGAIDDSVVAFSQDIDASELIFAEVLTDGGGGAAPGDSITYTIRVTNNGPSQIDDDFASDGAARVVDALPIEITDVSWTCTNLNPELVPVGFSVCGSLSGTGDIDVRLGMPPGVTVEIVATGSIRPDAAGTLVNTASVTVPTGVLDPDQTNNSATDNDTGLGAQADLKVTKISCVREDGQLVGIDDRDTCIAMGTDQLVPGGEVAYWITVENFGPSDVGSVAVTDIFPDAVNDVDWSCVGFPIPGLLRPTTDTLDQVEIENLSEVSFVLVSPDGRHVYASGAADDTVVVYRRSVGPGLLEPVSEVVNGDNHGSEEEPFLVDGLQGVSALVASPDGAHLYAASPISDSIAIFERNSVSGELTYVGLMQDGVGSVEGLGGVSALAIGTDGSRVYAAGTLDDAISVFSRAGGTGELTFVEVVREGDPSDELTVEGLLVPVDLELSGDGQHLFVAGNGGVGAIAIFDVSEGTAAFIDAVFEGDPTSDGVVSGLGGVRDLALTHDGRHLYAASEGSQAIALFGRDTATGEIEFVDSLSVLMGSGVPAVIEVAANDLEVYLAVSGGGNDGVVALSRDVENGNLTEIGAVLDGVAMVDGLSGVSSIALSPEAKHLYAAGTDDDAVSVFDRLTGSRCAREGSGNILDNASIVSMGNVTYLAVGRINSAALGKLINRASATAGASFTDIDTGNNEDPTNDDLVPLADLAVSKERIEPTAVPGLDVTYQITVRNLGPSDLVGATVTDNPPIYDPGVVDAGLVADSVEWQCLADTSLQFTGAYVQGGVAVEVIDGLDEVVEVAVSSDGLHLYAVGRISDAVAVFKRNADTASPDYGRLEFLQSITNGDTSGDATVEGLGGAGSIVVSPDDAHVYVGGYDDDSVVAFIRISDDEDPDFGTLVFEQVLTDDVGGVFGLDGVASLGFAPDGRHLFAASDEADAVAVFARDNDPQSLDYGRLSYVARFKDGFGDLPLGVLNGASVVAASPDGAHVVVASSLDDSLAVFSHEGDGMLLLVQVVKDDGAAVPVPGASISNGLDYPSGLAFGPGGEHLYVASLADDSLTMFERDADLESDGFGTLSMKQIFLDGFAGATMLNGASSVAVSPDGATVVVVARNDDSLTLFRRDSVNGGETFGQLEPLQAIVDGQQTAFEGVPVVIEGLDAPVFATYSGDGGHIYTASAVDDAIAGFARTAISSCTADGLGAILDTVDLTAGSSVTYTLTGRLHTSARGEWINVASVAGTAEVPEPPNGDPDNNSDSADDEPITLTPVSNLSILKTNNQLTSVKGLETTYTITVVNDGPSDAIGATVADVFELGTAGFVDGSIGWTCAFSPGSLCSASGAGDISDSVLLLAGGTLIYSASAVVHPNASGEIVNTAAVISEPPPASDPDLTDNSSTDIDGVVTITDLSITKSSGGDQAVRGAPLTYFVTITNFGPSQANGVVVADVFPTELLDAEWMCIGGPGASCTGSSGGITTLIDDLAVLEPGASAVYTVTGTVDQTAGDQISNTASVAPSIADTDPELGNNQATDVDEVISVTDLLIDKTNNVDVVMTGETVTYVITVSNNGPSDAPGVVVADVFPIELLDAEWSCEPIGDCGAGGISSEIDDLIDILAYTSVVYTVVGTVDPMATGELINTASVTANAAATEPNTTNNESTDNDPIEEATLWSDGFETGDTSGWSSESSAIHSVDLDDTLAEPWIAMDVSDGLTELRARFQLDLSAVSMLEGSIHLLASGDDGSDANRVFEIELGRNATDFEFRGRIFDDATADFETGWATTTSTTMWIEIVWRSGPGDGGFELWIDGVLAEELNGITNSSTVARRVLLGGVVGVDPPTSGFEVFSNFRWSRGSMIPGGPLPGGKDLVEGSR